MTSRSTNFRLASAAVAGVAVVATSMAALVLPGLAKADDPSADASASPTAVRSVKQQPAASVGPVRNAPDLNTDTAPSTKSPSSGPSADSDAVTNPSSGPKASTGPKATEGATPEVEKTPDVETTNAPGSSASFGPTQEWTVLDPRFDKSTLNMLNGETFTLYADVLHSQPLEQDLSIKLDALNNLDCDPIDETTDAGAIAGLETFSAKCEITKSQSVISGAYQFVQADGSVIGEGIFGANPGELPDASGSAKAEPGGVSKNTSKDTDDQNDNQTDDQKKATGEGETDPSGPTTETEEADRATIEIAKARFTPESFTVVPGQEFRVEKDVTISDAPLHSALTMSIERQQNLTCDPQSAGIDEGAEGTHTLTFDCTITGVDRAPGAWYDITLADGTVLIDDAYFGLSEGGEFSEPDGDKDSNDNGSKKGSGDSSSTNGGLANTGGPLLGFVAAGTLLTAAGAQLIRRRR